MHTGRFTRRLGYSLIGTLASLSVGLSGAQAQGTSRIR
jgi:hypothetical protein